MPCVEITPDDFDNMHHALGRPDLATLEEGENFRNHFVIGADNPLCAQFEATGCWEKLAPINLGKSNVYRVTQDGKSALADWLSLQQPARSKP